MNVRSLLTLLSALFLTSCGLVTVKQIAGDRVPENISRGLCRISWKGSDGTVGGISVEDEARGLYVMRSKPPGEKEEKIHFAFRTLGDRMVATAWGDGQAKDKEPMFFFRVAIKENHLAFFMPDNEKFKEAVKKKLIPGEIVEDVQWGAPEGGKKPQKTERAVLDKFGTVEANKLGGVLACFDPDPDLVLVRMDDQPVPAAKKSGKVRNKK